MSWEVKKFYTIEKFPESNFESSLICEHFREADKNRARRTDSM